MEYAASVHGDPTKPSTVEALPTSERRLPRICCTNGTLLAGSSMGFSRLTSSMLQQTSLCQHELQPFEGAGIGAVCQGHGLLVRTANGTSIISTLLTTLMMCVSIVPG